MGKDVGYVGKDLRHKAEDLIRMSVFSRYAGIQQLQHRLIHSVM